MNRCRWLPILMIGLSSGWSASAWSTSTLFCSSETFDVMFHVGSGERGEDKIVDARLYDTNGLVSSAGPTDFVFARIKWPMGEPPYAGNELLVRFGITEDRAVDVQSTGTVGTIRVAGHRESARCDWSR